jgi:hypothetical protein
MGQVFHSLLIITSVINIDEVRPITPLDTLVRGGDVDVSIDERGSTVLVWSQRIIAPEYRSKIFGRCYAQGSHLPLGDAFQISTDTTSHVDVSPCVVAHSERIFTTWLSSPDGIQGRTLNISDVSAVVARENLSHGVMIYIDELRRIKGQ